MPFAISRAILNFCLFERMTDLFSWSNENNDPPKQYSVTIITCPLSAHAPTNKTRFGCLTFKSVDTSRLNSLIGFSLADDSCSVT